MDRKTLAILNYVSDNSSALDSSKFTTPREIADALGIGRDEVAARLPKLRDYISDEHDRLRTTGRDWKGTALRD